jgi:hypothetical protein
MKRTIIALVAGIAIGAGGVAATGPLKLPFTEPVHHGAGR